MEHRYPKVISIQESSRGYTPEILNEGQEITGPSICYIHKNLITEYRENVG